LSRDLLDIFSKSDFVDSRHPATTAGYHGAVGIVKPKMMQSRPLVSAILSLPGVAAGVIWNTFDVDPRLAGTDSDSPYASHVTVPLRREDR
jgi:hypothetical protein